MVRAVSLDFQRSFVRSRGRDSKPLRAGRRGPALFAAAVLGIGALSPLAHATLPAYTLVGQYAAPSGVWNIGPDGRLWSINSAGVISRQDSLNAAGYSAVGSVPAGTVASFGASFISVSNTGTLAIGDNNFGANARVHFVSSGDLSTGAATPTRSLLLGNYAGVWSGSDLLVAGAPGPGGAPAVWRVTNTATTSPTSSVLITGVGAGSGGVALRGDTLVTGVGFSTAGSPVTGEVRSFSLSSLINSGPATFLSGSVVGTVLSASSMAFDPLGNLAIAGTDFSNFPSVSGFVRVIDGDNFGTGVTLAPAGTDRSYSVRFNAVTNEYLVSASGTIYRYAIPTPGTAAALGLAGVMVAARRRSGVRTRAWQATSESREVRA
jgi:hypothetical protein